MFANFFPEPPANEEERTERAEQFRQNLRFTTVLQITLRAAILFARLESHGETTPTAISQLSLLLNIFTLFELSYYAAEANQIGIDVIFPNQP